MDVVYNNKTDMKNAYDIFGLLDIKKKKYFDFRYIWEYNIKVYSKEPERENVGCIRLA
jgi:hypothetical protein